MLVKTEIGEQICLWTVPVGHCFRYVDGCNTCMKLSDHGRDPASPLVRVLQIHGVHVLLMPKHTDVIYLGEPTLTLGAGRLESHFAD